MSVTAQEFRQVAEECGYASEVRGLFLAAAEQTEQLDLALDKAAHFEMEAQLLSNTLGEAREQIATLTARVAELEANLDAVKAWLEDYATTHYVSPAGKFVALKAILSDEAKAAK